MRKSAFGITTLTILLSFQIHAQYFSPEQFLVNSPERAEWTDLNGDNLGDFVYLLNGELYYVVNNYPNGFFDPVLFHTDPSMVKFEIWDQDKNGINDVFFFTSTGLYLLENDGELNWQEASYQGPLYSANTQLDYLNNDSKVDMWRQYTNNSTNRIERRLLDGNGSYTTPSNLNIPYEITPWDTYVHGKATAVDVNSDGHCDFYATFAECAPFTSCTQGMSIFTGVYINQNGTGFSFSELSESYAYSLNNMFEKIDLDMDGIVDDLLTTGWESNVRLYQGNADGFPVQTIYGNYVTEMAAPGDWDGDGIRDIFIRSYNSPDYLKIALSDASNGDFFNFSWSLYFEPQAADIDGNGVCELLHYNAGNGTYYFHTMPVYGCVDITACNYTEGANVDDGSCNYVLGCGDFNGDDETDIADLLLFLSYFGCTLDCEGDLNADSIVNIIDLLIFMGLL